jgi:hypothetical protein
MDMLKTISVTDCAYYFNSNNHSFAPPLMVFGFSDQVLAALADHGFYTIKDLAGCGKGDLQHIHAVGEKKRAELYQLGFDFKTLAAATSIKPEEYLREVFSAPADCLAVQKGVCESMHHNNVKSVFDFFRLDNETMKKLCQHEKQKQEVVDIFLRLNTNPNMIASPRR